MANVLQPANCASCGRPLPAQMGRGRQRRYCGPTCRSAARRGRSRLVTGGYQDDVNGDLTIAARKSSLDSVAGSDDVVGQVAVAADRFSLDWAGPDPLTAVASARDLAAAVDGALRAAVTRAREAGCTWQTIGDLLGTSRQAAFQRFGRPIDPRTGVPMERTMLAGAEDRAAAVLADLMAGRYEEARHDFDDTMLSALSVDKLAETTAQVAAMVGAYEGMGSPFARAHGDFTVVDVPLLFEAGEMIGRVSYRPDGAVAGLFVLRPEFA
jgi:uncharacterized protein DUF3887